MAQHSKYWSCTPFADWIRGTPKNGAKTSKDWNQWRKDAKKSHPVRYWLAEESLDRLQDFITWPVRKLYDAKYYINNRWVTRTHQLTASPQDIKPGDWCDLGNRFLPCLFNELVDFVEIEQAWHHIAWDKEAREKYRAPWWSHGWFRWRVWRCPEAGLEYFRWAAELTNEEWLPDDQKHLIQLTPQAIAAREILELYNWWKNIYPNRPDPMDASGWTDYCERRRQRIKEQDPDAEDILFMGSGRESEEERNKSVEILDLCSKIEQEYENEDTEMMIRLIKIRKSLWT